MTATGVNAIVVDSIFTRGNYLIIIFKLFSLYLLTESLLSFYEYEINSFIIFWKSDVAQEHSRVLKVKGYEFNLN